MQTCLRAVPGRRADIRVRTETRQDLTLVHRLQGSPGVWPTRASLSLSPLLPLSARDLRFAFWGAVHP